MTASTFNVSDDDRRIARLAALAIAIHVAEAALPSPLPGVKPGFANIITLLVLYDFGWRSAAWVALLRVLIGSLVIGTFLAPPFMLSLAGASCSLVALGLGRWLPGIGPLGLGVLAALAHMAGQFLVAWWLFLPHPALWQLLPLFMSAALVFGIVSGIITHSVMQRLAQSTP